MFLTNEYRQVSIANREDIRMLYENFYLETTDDATRSDTLFSGSQG